MVTFVSSPGPVVVAGGLNIDILSRPFAALRPGTSNPAQTEFAPGGVGRNLAQNLAQLGYPVRLLGVVGDDPFGQSLLDKAGHSGVDISGVLRRPGPTGSYLAVLDERGELHCGLSSMALTAALTPADAAPWLPLLGDARLLIVDANLSPALVDFLLEAAWQRGLRVVLEPVSAPKALELRPLLSPRRPLWLLTPDRAELAALVGEPTLSDDPDALIGAARLLRTLGAQWVLLTLGRGGSLLVGEGEPLLTPARRASVRDVTGAGDAFLAGLIAALEGGLPWPGALAQAHLCAALTTEVIGAVRADLSTELLRRESGRAVLAAG